jgi:cytochrome c6
MSLPASSELAAAPSPAPARIAREDGRKHPYAPGRERKAVPFLTCAAVLIATVVLGVHPTRAADPTPEQIDQGREVYEEFCAMCHGRDMVNTGGFAFDLRKFPKDDPDRFRNSVLNGKNQGMPAWRDKLGDDDVTLLWAYVSSGGTD